jgi:phosphatidylglycerol:prolipoprotein diacylglycerol transferase
VPTHPYPLYEAAADLLVVLGLWLVSRRLKRPGTSFLVAALAYAAIRFGLTYLRQEAIVLWGLQEAQVIALLTAAVAAALLLARARPMPGAPSRPAVEGLAG